MSKLNYLNLGCGTKFHKDWVNLDMYSNSPYVIEWNLLNGIPFSDNEFDVIYHSQVLEHFTKDQAKALIDECFRVMRPGGIIRVVVPDLENMVNEYKKFLEENLISPSSESEANYDWIMLELYDQAVRSYSGGSMSEFLRQPVLINEQYIINRIGFIGHNIREEYKLSQENKTKSPTMKKKIKKKIIMPFIQFYNKVFISESRRLGKFILSGQVHRWMYDRYSLARLLKNSGFEYIKVKSPHDSEILNWAEYELDVKNNLVYDPTSLFMEAKKPISELEHKI